MALSPSEGFAGLSTPGKIVIVSHPNAFHGTTYPCFMLRDLGKQVGVSAESLNFASVDLIAGNIRGPCMDDFRRSLRLTEIRTVFGSLYGSQDDMRSAFDLLSQVRVHDLL